MDDSTLDKANKPDSWEDGVILVLQKLHKIGWVGGANLIGCADGSGRASVDFTPLGIESLKPFADLWQKVGGFNQRDALALFFIAIRSQKT